MAGPGIVVGIAGDTTGLNAALNSASTTVGGFGNRLTGVANSKGFQSVAQGVGMGVGISAYGLLAKGISMVTDFLADAARMAAEDEQSVGLLTASLKANIPAWDGSMVAIEGVISAGQKLAFTDDAIRDSLARLAPVTHDNNESFKILAVAEDLARFSHISLADATTALISSEGGRYRALGKLIGSTKEITSSTEALAAVEKLAQGSAEAYAQSGLGKMEAAQDRVKESQERLGKSLIPIQVAWNDFIATEADGLVVVATLWDRFGQENHAALSKAEADLYANADAMGITAGAVKQGSVAMGQSVADFRDGVIYSSGKTNAAMGAIGSVWKGVSYDIRANSIITKQTVEQQFKELTDYVKNRFTDPALVSLLSGKGSMGHELVKDLASNKPDIIAKAGEIVTGLIGRMTTPQLQALVSGKSAVGAKLLAELNSSNPAIRSAAKRIMDNVQNELNKRVDIVVNVYTRGATNTQGKALGGPVRAGEPYIVGEHRPEVFVPTENGTILPSVPAFASGRSGAAPGPMGLSVNVYGNVYGPGGEDELADRISQRLRLVGSTR